LVYLAAAGLVATVVMFPTAAEFGKRSETAPEPEENAPGVPTAAEESETAPGSAATSGSNQP
jgi:hypothetical protein